MHNLLLMSDSYKYSHIPQYPPNTEYISCYIESRGGAKESVFFGLQAFIKQYLLTSITKDMVDEAQDVVVAHGLPFFRDPWDIIVNEFSGKLPISIQAVSEGTVMATSNVQVQITNTDKRFFWLPSFLETAILRSVWYPSTVATKSREMKKLLIKSIEDTSDGKVFPQINFKLHDFGARGATSHESASIGALGHLLNFMGTDTIEAIVSAKRYYNENMAGWSIPASEHATITSWGSANEQQAFENMIDQFAGKDKIYACVSDSYNIYHAVGHLWGEVLKEKIISKGGTLVVRPDSGDPTVVPIDVIKILMSKFGFETNSKGYKVLPSYIRVIQGDGITEDSLQVILKNLKEEKLSIDNIAFGMGGGLLQAWNRDTLKYAMKTSAIKKSDSKDWENVFKKPIHGGKTSKAGRLALIFNEGRYETILEKELGNKLNMLHEVYRNGELLIDQTLEEIRANVRDS